MAIIKSQSFAEDVEKVEYTLFYALTIKKCKMVQPHCKNWAVS